MAELTLRKKGKQRRIEQVLDAAQALFHEQGYNATKIEDIAKRASVVPGTVYNYFSTKPNILMQLALRHVEAALPERRRFMARLPSAPIDGIFAFECLLAEQALRHLSRESWRALMAAQYLEPEGPVHRTGLRLNLLIKRQYVTILATYQQRGRIQAWVHVAELADLIVGITTWNFSRRIASSTMSQADVLRIGGPQLRLIMEGLLTPHEDSA
ncbi:TetR/AcrR family transcriptional regulator [Acidisoma silvae]|uniref:TetR/AcrR family transcriptional regulator n=1 Tax=Acidisoma silvae TaxID=2802396 RepID=A0A964E193_9PROT|nr:TetR/AcrR family transcriptional regulator [Acidisoma silvae]MCB8877548.1 TetR/AcrR family transcriptional regulator [Acidisoma silvae]